PSIGTHAHFAIQNDPRLVRLTPPTPTELTTLSLHDALPISGADIQIPNGHGGMVRTAGYTGEVWPHVVSWDPTSTEDFFDILKLDRKSTRLNSSHVAISYAVFCLKKHNWRVAHRLAREVVAK